jgi:hypothetical protein
VDGLLALARAERERARRLREEAFHLRARFAELRAQLQELRIQMQAKRDAVAQARRRGCFAPVRFAPFSKSMLDALRRNETSSRIGRC